MEELEAFADPDELALVRSYSYYEEDLDDEPWFLGNQTFVLEDKPVELTVGLLDFYVPGYVVKASYSESEHNRHDVGRIKWSPEGNVLNLFLGNVKEQDIALLSQHKSLESLSIYDGTARNADLDLESLLVHPQLESLHLAYGQLFNFQSVCGLENLEWLTAPVSYPQGPIRFSQNCRAPLKMLGFGTARLDDLEVANLPQLKELYLAKATIRWLAIDGASLPELEYINLREAELPEDLSQVHLPDNLVQLYLQGVTNDSVNQLDLPDNLKYLDLSSSRLSDYSFITTAENLESLSLQDSDFTQFELLASLPKLKHLRLPLTSFQQNHLKYLTGLTQLEELDLSGANITDIRPLTDLSNLDVLILSNTSITDLNKIPQLPQLSYIALPNQDDNYDRPSHLPNHIKAILNKTPDPYDYSRLLGEHCIDSDKCTIAPWLIEDNTY
ncbi:leucine-rich repeat domain-containing protein [Saccharospirillum impatiens]|uniref:leucine-rich repeat domain-containing protein n=1 Tax=Saccharospirillum impatiens TaxID=169438 RepID=UPI0012F94435|nr:leucine-rich repeat domain-containing protein [Saccharospirillum impatiens]